MKKKITIKIKPEDVKVRNELHFDVQRRTRANIFKNKKGKGSFKRNKKVEVDE
jgi:stalled ribosome alternative rescue factor ArfA